MKYVLVITMHADPAMAPGYDEWGGTHTYMKELMDGLNAKKINCIMVTRKSMPLPDTEQYNEHSIVYRLQNGSPEPMDKTLLQYYHAENLSKIQAIIDKHGKPLIIHSVYWNSGRLAMELGQKNGVSYVHSVISNSRGRVSRGAIEPVARRADYEQQIYEKAAWVICVSDDERQDIIRFYGISPDKVCVAGQYIHESFLLPAHDDNGFPRLNSRIDAHTQERLALQYNNAYLVKSDEAYWSRKVFTYIGRMSFYKGIDHIVSAWYKLYESYGAICPPLWLVGGSVPEICDVRDAVKISIPMLDSLEKGGKLVWWGYLDAAGLSTVLLKSHVLIAHSRYEPGGRVVVEAMGEGIPVIATSNGFAKDYIVNWRNGFLVEYADDVDLSLRLEHFVRQPFLSNALGQNARRDAKAIIKKWNFIDNHLIAYGIDFETEPTDTEEDASHDYFKRRSIHLFPYYNLPLSKDFLLRIFEQLTRQQAVTFSDGIESEYTSRIFKIQGIRDTVILKQAFTRLSISPLFNPFEREEYVRRADRHYHIELNAYQRSGSNVLIGFDPAHYMLALKELLPVSVVDINFLRQCIRYIVKKKNIATEQEMDVFHHIMQSRAAGFEDIQDIYRRLRDELPEFYFEASGVFSEKLGWAEAAYFIEYNRNSISADTMERLKIISAYFAGLDCGNTRSELRCINIDTELKHFMLDGDALEMIDFEKCAIGCVENEIAGVICDFMTKQQLENEDGILSGLLELLPVGINKKKTVVSMAYRCFYDVQVNAVMHRKSLGYGMERLELLYSFARGMDSPCTP